MARKKNEQAKDSFVLYSSLTSAFIECMTDEQAGKLFRAILAYAKGEKVPTMGKVLKMAFSVISAQMERDFDKWEHIRKERQKAGKKGGMATAKGKKRPKKSSQANGSKSKQGLSNQAVTVTVTDNVTVTDTVLPPIIPPKGGKVEKPTKAEIEAYAKEKGAEHLASAFFEFYEASGWSDNKGAPLKNWKQVFLSWKKTDGKQTAEQVKTVAAADARAEREAWYSQRRQAAQGKADKAYEKAMKNKAFFEAERKGRSLEIELAKAELRAPEKVEGIKAEIAAQEEIKRQALESMGMTSADLVPQWHCRKCQDSGFMVNGLACSCYKKEQGK